MLAPVFIVVLMLLSPIFSVAEVTLVGNERIAREYILRELGLHRPSAVNIFLYNSRAAISRLDNHYIESLEIDKYFLARRITVSLVERRLAGFVEFSPGQYLFIDENGLVLETSTVLADRLPIVVGLDFSGFTVGARLGVSDERVFENLVAVSRLLSRHGLESDVVRLDLNDSSNIRLFIGDLDVSLGDTADGDLKIAILIEILEHLDGENVRGSLDISDITRNPILRHLT
ncbi:MAG: cell division protein FtsQ/DivIB [Defluviitaleaceae bacterium]|nr:cell division protein FtsQ/DivIB [Defluviitaleaceae bacterium]